MGTIDWAGISIAIKGAGEMASGIAVRLWRSGFRRICMMEVEHPLAVRRKVSFCEAVHDGIARVEGIEAIRVENNDEILSAWENGQVPIIVDPQWTILDELRPHVLIDATLAKRNLGTVKEDAFLVIGLGPGFTAPIDVDRVIETMRGHHLGCVISDGAAQANTGIPGNIGGHTLKRVLRAPDKGTFVSHKKIKDKVKVGDVIATVNGQSITAEIDGVVRGLIREGTTVSESMKVGDIDPRGIVEYCSTVSEKSRSIGGAVLEAILGAADRFGMETS